MPMVYNATNALGTFGPIARNCYAAGSASSDRYSPYIGKTFVKFLDNTRMNIIMNHLDINDRALSLWTSVPDLDYGQIAFDISRTLYLTLINGDEEELTPEGLLQSTNGKKKHLRKGFVQQQNEENRKTNQS